MAQPLSIMSTLALQGVLDVLAPLWAKTNAAPAMVFDPTKSISQRIADGARGDIAILTAAAIDDFTAKGVFAPGSRKDLALSYIGVAVAAGAARPDISTPASFRATLLATPSLAYSRAGASGLFFAGLIERLGIAAEVNAKATVIRGEIGFDGLLITDDLAMGALAGMANDLASAALSAGCDVVLHCTGKLEDAAALLPDCPVLSDDALRRLAFADAARRGFGAGDHAALRGVRDGVLAVPVVAVGEVDPTER